MFQNISADRLETLLDQGRAFTLADVREPEEYREGHLAGAVNLPVQQILKITEQSGFFEDPEKFLGISRKRPVIVYCSHGGRGMQAARLLSGAGYQAVNVYGGLSCYRGRHLTVPGGRGDPAGPKDVMPWPGRPPPQGRKHLTEARKALKMEKSINQQI